MFRQILSYAPATVVPAVVSFLMIYVYTRLLTPVAYGDFSLVFSAILVVQTSVFFAIPMAVIRFYPEAMAQQRKEAFLSECYLLFYALTLLILVLVAVASACLLDTSAVRSGLVRAGLGFLILIARSAVVLNQSANRMALRMGRFNTIECAHAVLGFGFGSLLVYWLGGNAEAVLLGLLIAATICMLADYKIMLLPFRYGWSKVDRKAMGRLIRFSMPLIAMDLTVCILALSDRFLLEMLGGAGALGIYTVAFNLVERPTTLIASAITTATFPISVQTLQDDGRDAGGRQVGRNAAALLAVMIPGCVGLAFTAPYLSAVMIGPEFRVGVAALIPIMCLTALFRGISSHVSDHAFHLAGRPTVALFIYAPAAAANIVFNILLIPAYGVFGAACSALACQAFAVVVGCAVGQRIFPIYWPLREITKIVVALVPMVIGLSLITFSVSWGGLSLAVCSSALVFSITALLLDVGGFGLVAMNLVRRRVHGIRTLAADAVR